MKRFVKLRPRGLAAKLYCVAAAAIAMVTSLAAVSVLFAYSTGRAVTQLQSQAVTGAASIAELELLFERHRRIIEAAPTSIDSERLETSRRQAELMTGQIARLLDGKNDPFLKAIAAGLPALIAHGRRAIPAGSRQAADVPTEAVEAYLRVAKRLQDHLALHRSQQLDAAHKEIENLVDRSGALIGWVVAVSGLALLLIGPLSLLIVRRVAQRLKTITETMRLLASNETGIDVPLTSGTDEIGEMARAIEVFKANAIALLYHRDEIERINGWFDIALSNMTHGLSMFDGEGRLIVCNRRYREFYGLPGELTRPGTAFSAIVALGIGHKGRGRRASDAGAAQTWQQEHRAAIQRGQQFSETHRLNDGCIIQITCQPLQNGGWVDVHEDVTEKRRAEEQIRQLAHSDTLTGLANRRYFLETLEAGFATLEKGTPFAVLWIDIDRFKEVNDHFGHPAGDALLLSIASRLRQAVRESDFVARLGGDEFAIIARGSPSAPVAASALASRLVEEIGKPFEVLGHSLNVGASIGVAFAPRDGTASGELMKNADLALYRAKAEGRGRYVNFEPALETTIKERRQLEIDLRQALSLGEMEMHYQPIADLRSNSVTGFEALMRWRHPKLGIISPAEFIPMAEKTGLIAEMDEWALIQACQTAMLWPENVSVSVNLSAAQFSNSEIVEVVSRALEAAGLPAHRLELEVTETVLLKDEAAISNSLHNLRRRGVSISLDDFGTGYSSLSYLQSFPFDKIKIDQTFVRNLPQRDDCVTIVRAIADLARTLGMKSVAEGVETLEHLEQVRAAGCDQVQGYYFGKPVPSSLTHGVLAACRQTLAAA